MKAPSPKSTRLAREMTSFVMHLPGFYSFASLTNPWPATGTPSDTPNFNIPTPEASTSIPLAEQAERIRHEIEQLDRTRYHNDALYFKARSELFAEKARIAEQASTFKPRFTADIEREIRRQNQSQYPPGMRGPQPLRRGGRPAASGSAMDIDTSFRREPSLMDIDGASFSRPQPQPQRPVRACPSVIMTDSSFCMRDRKARRGGSIRVESVGNIDPAVAAQAARDKEESDRIAAEQAHRMSENIKKHIAAEREKARIAEEARQAAEAARWAEEARKAEKARKAEEAARLAEEARKEREAREAEEEELRQYVAAEAEASRRRKAAKAAHKARSAPQYFDPRWHLGGRNTTRKRAEAKRAAEAEQKRQAELEQQRQAELEAQRLAEEEERLRAADTSLRANIHRDCAAINAEPDATIRAFKLFEYKLNLVKTQYKALVEDGIKLDIADLPWPIFSPETAQDILNRNGEEPLNAISAFLLHEDRPEIKDVQPKKVVRNELLRLHPDKMRLPMIAVVQDGQKEECESLINVVTGCLNDLNQRR